MRGCGDMGAVLQKKIAWEGRVHTVEFLMSGHETYFDEGPELGEQQLESSHSLEAVAKGHNWFSSFRSV